MSMRLPGKSFWIGFACGALVVVLAFAGLLAGAYILSKRMLTEMKLPPPSFSGPQEADLSWNVRALDGTEVPLESFKGQVVFLNFWATWCMPCRVEMPGIGKLHAALNDEVTFACVSDEPA